MNELSPKELDLLQRIDDSEELRPLFFRKVRGLKWFNHLKERGYFEPEQNPAPTPPDEEGYVKIPSWQALDYLVKTAPELRGHADTDYPKRFLSILVNATDYAQGEGYGNYRTWWQFAEVIRNIPASVIALDDLRVIDYWLEDRFDRGLVAREVGEEWLPSLLESGEKHELEIAGKLVGILYAPRIVEKELAGRKRQDAVLRFDDHYIKRITQKTARQVGEKIGAPGVDVFDNHLKTILDALENDTWSAIWLPAIEDHEQNKYRDDAENLIVEAYRESLAGFIQTSANSGFEYVAAMLSGDYQTVKRIAIHAIGENVRVCSELLPSLISPDFLHESFRHEMWQLLHEHYDRLSASDKDKLRDIIGQIVYEDEEGNLLEGATAYSRSNWFAAIKDFGERESDLYYRCVKVSGVEPDHPSFSSYISSGTVVHQSPVALDDLKRMSIEELAEVLESYRGDSESFHEPGIEGLSRALKDVVKSSPLAFYGNLEKFLDCDLAYVHQIIEAYRDIRAGQEKLPWNAIWPALLDFCNSIVKAERFWNEENAAQRSSFVANRYGVVSAIAMLIESGTKSDENAFDPELMGAAEGVLCILLERETGNEFKEDSDAVSIAINSPRGRSIQALINMALRACRLEDRERKKNHSAAWSHYVHYFDAELERRRQQEYDFSVLVTNYLPNFLYMSREWTIENLGEIFDNTDKIAWRSAMQGYAYVDTVYEEIFSFLKTRGHFLEALDDEHLRARVRERIVQNIGVAYRSGFEDLSDKSSLIYMLVDRGEYEELSELIRLFWTMRESDDLAVLSKVMALWRVILDRLDDSTIEGKRLASKLCQLIVFVDHIDENNKDLVLRVVPYADFAHNSYEVLRSIARISENQPFEAAEIWSALLQNATPDYPEEAIRSALSNLVAAGAEGGRKAKEITSIYLRVPNEKPASILRDLTGC
jgi:hypothetical protein